MFIVLGIALLMTVFSLEDEQGMLPQTLYTAVEFVAAEAPHVWINNDSQNREQTALQAENALDFLYFKGTIYAVFVKLLTYLWSNVKIKTWKNAEVRSVDITLLFNNEVEEE